MHPNESSQISYILVKMTRRPQNKNRHNLTLINYTQVLA